MTPRHLRSKLIGMFLHPYSLIDGRANYTTISGTPISLGAHEISLYPPSATPFYHDYKSLRQPVYEEDPFSVSHEGRLGGKGKAGK
jgi:hypothetical protein